MDPKHLYTIAEITEALTLRGSLQDQVDELKRQVAALKSNTSPATARPRGGSDKILYSRREAALQLSISLSTLEQLIVQGELQVRRLGKRILIPRKELERLAVSDVRIVWPEKRQGKTVRK